jgi:hypothetical protein
MTFKRILLYLLLLVAFSSCIPEEVNPNSCFNCSRYYPILMSRADADASIRIGPPQPIRNAGKLYIFRTQIFVIEEGLGVHIYDNFNPAAPRLIAFLSVLNASDIAISEGILYANQSTDLIAVDITNLADIEVTTRLKDIAEDVPPDNLPLWDKYTVNRPDDTIVARWELIR